MRILLRQNLECDILADNFKCLENQELHFIAILLRAISDPRGDKDYRVPHTKHTKSEIMRYFN